MRPTRETQEMHLLLVEDDAMLADALCQGALQNAWRVDHVSDAVSARIALVDHHYSAVLLDLGLPGDSGLTVLKAMLGRFWARTTISSSPSSSMNSGRACAPSCAAARGT